MVVGNAPAAPGGSLSVGLVAGVAAGAAAAGATGVGAMTGAAAGGRRLTGALIAAGGLRAGAGVGASCAEAVAANSNASEAVRTGPQARKARENLNCEDTELVTETLT